MALHVSSTATPSGRDLRPGRAHSRLVSMLLLTAMIVVTGVVTGLVIAMALVGLVDQLTRAGH